MSTFTITCPHCGQVLEADDELGGKTFACPACRSPISIPDERTIRIKSNGFTPQKIRCKLFFTLILFVVVGLGLVVFALHKLRTGFQHPEDADDPSVLAAESALIREYSEGFSMMATEDFLLTFWDEEASRQARSQIIPWAIVKSRKTELEERIEQLTSSFCMAKTNYANALGLALKKAQDRGTDRRFLDDRLEREYREKTTLDR